MKKLLVSVFVLTGMLGARAQSYLGYMYDNYAGVQSTLYNPASIVDSRFKTDINLFSFSGLVSNDYYGVKFTDAIKNGYDFEKQATKSPLLNNNGLSNFDIMGPSFMFNLAPKHSIAIFTRARGIANVTNVNGEFFEKVGNNFDKSKDFNAPPQNFNTVANAWAELGLSYAAVILDKQTHFLKGGLSVKYLQGIANAYGNADNLTLDYKPSLTNDPKLNTITTKGLVSYGESQDYSVNSDYKLNSGSTGVGLDFGFVYEYRPDYLKFKTTNKDGKSVYFKDVNKYKYRFGLSVTDIGSIAYKEATQKVYNVNRTISEELFNSTKTEDILKNLYTVVEDKSANKAYLPTAVHANVDWNMYKKFYLNLNADLNVNSKTAINTNRIANTFSLTPRYESKWFSFYLPLTQSEYRGFQVGSGIRLGPLFVGSGSIISNLISDKSKGVDVHVGLKIPVYQGRMKDSDGDGVYDKFDKCPDVEGPAENNGCPYEDRDSDGVLNKEDKCPDIAGPKENKGCPYEDSDKDGTLDKDDKCPKVAGSVENKGCPLEDSDKDGVLDKDDKCPKVPGTVANKGCPEEKVVPVAEPVKAVEPNKEIIKKINEYSKTILFDTGKATIKSESFKNLDAIVGVLNEYKDAKFKIEGYTDSAGKPASNLKLSKNRAAAVKKYLVDKGVETARLTSEGYGSKRPIASNKTAKGKIQNRRVEIKLVK
jgi:outer membrane protein OmpA-like peptidoglycan-associated protein